MRPAPCTILFFDERILGDGDFVEKILGGAEEAFESRYALKQQGNDLEKRTQRVCRLTGLDPDRLFSGGKQPQTVQARSLFCFWGCRQLGRKAVELAAFLKISQPAVSQSVCRGEQLTLANGRQFLE